MRIRTLTIIGIILSIVCILIIANSIEQGDTNAVSMYLVVFLIPSCIVVVLNGLLLSLLSKQKSKSVKVIGSLLPVVILSLLSFKENLTFAGIDGNLVFVAQVGAIALGVTNLLWLISTLKVKPAAYGE
jgi:hypothetical protein